MRVIDSLYGQALLTILLLVASNAHAAPTALGIPLSIIGGANCGAAADWGTYFNGVLGGASLTLLLVMLSKMPNSVRQFFKTKHAIE